MTRDTPVSVTKLAYLGVETPDLDRMIHYYTQVLDFRLVDSDGNGAFLTTGTDHHCVVLTRGAARARTTVGYEIAGALDDAERHLKQAGYLTERRSDIGPGTPDVLVLEEPGTGTPLHLISGQDLVEGATPTPLRPTKLGHVAAFTPSLDRMQDFYQDLLGFRWSDTVGDFFVFLRCNSDHHAANFMASSKFEGMHHVAYEMRDPAHLVSMVDHLAQNKFRLEWGPGRHGPGHNLFTYHKDPDGNVVELFTQLDLVLDETKPYWEPRPWHEQHPMGPRTWEVDVATVNQWGPLNPSLLEH
ncbi:VOC family protein [Saccharopolyspora phatthalungensis]|uniref:Catechol 2,3-dioxygenase-like lactoylglutathione lyase family enzyme n=1 Tax=Saccharopolyspora phatthalungensis TaxID=664693 RepID=A0A840QEG3_9PSEU|nr:VOC family protein [Saccharopolyspora phatthalungensis]MBB5156969.1 catechol 2,3-dioxygenase-like lactoylglutathione lyase family enzyme [Saccharopolyspora phatthalungensis]